MKKRATTKRRAARKARTLDRLNDAVSSSNLKLFTAENILRAFTQEGISSLEDLARRTADAFHSPASRPGSPSMDALMRPAAGNALKSIVHPVPRLPFQVNGVEYDPSDIKRFNGRALYTIVGERRGKPELVAFDDHRALTTVVHLLYFSGMLGMGLKLAAISSEGAVGSIGPNFIPPNMNPPAPDGLEPPPPTQGSGGGPPVDSRVIKMYEHVAFQPGDVLELGPSLAYPNLTQVGRGLFGLGDWNDIISCLWTTTSHVVCWEHIDCQGSAMITGRYSSFFHGDLGVYGWNDRISSVLNCG